MLKLDQQQYAEGGRERTNSGGSNRMFGTAHGNPTSPNVAVTTTSSGYHPLHTIRGKNIAMKIFKMYNPLRSNSIGKLNVTLITIFFLQLQKR